jgi:surface carbohydrate biosynthesis protein
MTLERVAYLTCELKSRDLDTRLFIASHLCRMGIPVVVGQFWGINGNIGKGKCGCYLFATANGIQAEAMARAVDAGSVVVATDSEALPLADPLISVSAEAVEICEKFLADTDTQKDLLAKKFGTAKFITTGSPRLDLLSSMDIQEQAGPPYVLFNTGFGKINSVWGSAETVFRATANAMEVDSDLALLNIKAEQAAAAILFPLIKWLAPQIRVVVRPHPSENAETWRQEFPDIEVVEGSYSPPWIKGAKIVIHTNSTTGLEATALGVPALNIDPIPAWGDRYTVKLHNHTVQTLDQAQAILSDFLRTGKGPVVQNADNLRDLKSGGAKATAKQIAIQLKDAPPLSGTFSWHPADRTDLQRSKFTASLQEAQTRLTRFGFQGHIYKLDDSTFFISPATAK